TAKFYRDLYTESGRRTKVHMTQGIYRCRQVRLPDNPHRLKFRVADSRDLDTIAKWILDFHHEATPHDPLPNNRELAEAKLKHKAIYVVEKAKRIVSMAAWGRDIESSCSINLVYTPQMWRKRGYASVATAYLTQMFLEKGKKETNLYT